MEQSSAAIFLVLIIPTKKVLEQATIGQVKGQGAVKYDERVKEYPRISIGMTDSERTKILRYKKIVAPVYEGQADDVINANADKLKSSQLSVVKTAITKIGKEFGVYIDYDIKDVGVKISLSRNNLKESLQKEATPSQIAKLMPILKNVVKNSIGI